jgi:L-ascorbate metabolism protein UlaG (beta-lactamase superfamily)
LEWSQQFERKAGRQKIGKSSLSPFLGDLMEIRHIRNACIIIHSNGHRILVDPCLNPKGSLPPFTLFRKKPRFNPTIDLPPNAESELSHVTCGLITHCRHGHLDHLDKKGIHLLASKQVPTYCNSPDESYLRRRHINAIPLNMNRKNTFLNGSITPVPTAHGYDLVGMLMGPGAGYFIELPGDRSLYISGDTVMTPIVRNVLTDLGPDISILNAGTATLDFGRPILMPINEQLEFIRMAPGKVVAVHLEAFNHCLTSRDILREAVLKEGLSAKVIIPQDGELMDL